MLHGVVFSKRAPLATGGKKKNRAVHDAAGTALFINYQPSQKLT
jgi:hypothetical protein